MKHIACCGIIFLLCLTVLTKSEANRKKGLQNRRPKNPAFRFGLNPNNAFPFQSFQSPPNAPKATKIVRRRKKKNSKRKQDDFDELLVRVPVLRESDVDPEVASNVPNLPGFSPEKFRLPNSDVFRGVKNQGGGNSLTAEQMAHLVKQLGENSRSDGMVGLSHLGNSLGLPFGLNHMSSLVPNGIPHLPSGLPSGLPQIPLEASNALSQLPPGISNGLPQMPSVVPKINGHNNNFGNGLYLNQFTSAARPVASPNLNLLSQLYEREKNIMAGNSIHNSNNPLSAGVSLPSQLNQYSMMNPYLFPQGNGVNPNSINLNKVRQQSNSFLPSSFLPNFSTLSNWLPRFLNWGNTNQASAASKQNQKLPSQNGLSYHPSMFPNNYLNFANLFTPNQISQLNSLPDNNFNSPSFPQNTRNSTYHRTTNCSANRIGKREKRNRFLTFNFYWSRFFYER